MRSLKLLGLVALMGASLYGADPVYWSTAPSLDCTGAFGPMEIVDANNAHVGWSCWVAGVFNWYAAGGAWGSSIRVYGPAATDIGTEFWFYDEAGNDLSLDTNVGSDHTLTFSLHANQPAELKLLGAHSNPSHSTLEDGTVWAAFYCPDAPSCLRVEPQLIYSALPAVPYSLSVPIVWDDLPTNQWSAVGVDNGGTKLVSLVVYNNDVSTVATRFTIRVYDSNGNLYGSGLTPPLAPIPTFSDGTLGEGETWGGLLSAIVSPLPSGPFKVFIDGGSVPSAVEVLQFNGNSATTLQVADDSMPLSAASIKGSAAPAPRVRTGKPHRVIKTRPAFKPLPR